MKVLLHVCCGPCAIYPLRVLRELGHEVEGFFFNPNIHPFKEFQRRINSLRDFAKLENLSVEIDDNYGLKEYLRRVVFHEEKRCMICYEMRLESAALHARKTGADAFTSTLLYSRYQKHDQIREKGELLAEKYSISFLYDNFRIGWQEGVDRSKELGLYRQPYCGCIYSEQERYDRKLRTANTKEQEKP